MNLKNLFDLTENESKLLDIFLEKAILTTGDITKLSGISRPNCYDLLNRLIEKGLITRFVENNLVQYSINRIDYEEMLKEKKTELENLQLQIKEYNKNIEKAEEKRKNHYSVEVFTGTKGLIQALNQILKSKTVSVFGAEGKLELDHPAIWNVWTRKVKEKKIDWKVIYNEKNRELRKEKKIMHLKQRYVERDFLTNVTTQIMDEQVNIYHWQEIPLVIVIKSKEIANSYRKEFDFMWGSAKE